MWLRLIAYLFFILSCFSYGLLWLKAKPNYKIGMGIGKRGARNLGPLALASGVSMSECECVSADRFRLINITFQFLFMIRRFVRTMEWPQAHNTLPHKHIDTDSSSARSCAPSVRTGALWLLLSLFLLLLLLFPWRGASKAICVFSVKFYVKLWEPVWVLGLVLCATRALCFEHLTAITHTTRCTGDLMIATVWKAFKLAGIRAH